jgi:hypothetical protein
MTDERMQAIEQAIAAQEAAGRNWTNQSIYDNVGGNYGGLAQYLKARRAQARGEEVATAVAAVEAPEPTSLQEELAAAEAAEQYAEARLSLLEEQATRQLLSEAEEVEVLRLERRLGTLASVITRLQREIEQEKESLDIEAFVAAWLPTVEHKRALYAQFAADVRQLWQSLGAILAQHDAQLEGLMQLPPRLQKYMLDTFLPDRNTIKARLAQQMGNPAWSQVLLAPATAQGISADTLMENDPGTKTLPPRLIQNALNQGRPIERSA